MCYTALAEHYPAPRFSQIVNKITHTEYTKIRKEEKDNSEKLSAYKHGVILCMLRLAKADTSKCMWDESPMKGVIEVMLSFCLDCIRITKKSYVLSNGLEVISYILSNHANEDTTWEGLDAMWDDLTAELAAIAVGAGEGSSRVSPVSISIGCLATLYKFRPKQTQKVLSEANADFMGTLRKLISSSDPAIRGSVSIFFGEVVSSTLFMHEELKDITLLDVVNELSDKLKEKLYSVKKSACTALGICLNACTRYGQKPEFYELATLIVTTLLGISADDYWVVRVEVARILSEVDYEVLAKNSQNMLGIQDQAFDFVLGLLESNDPKIRNRT